MPVYYLEIIVVVLGLVMLMMDAFAPLADKRSIGWLGVIGLAVVFGLLFVVEWPESTEGTFWQFYATDDPFSLYFKGIAILSTLVVLIMAVIHSPVVVDQTAHPERGAHPQAGLGEFFALPMFACAGLMWMASAQHLVSIFVALETVTISFYVLVAYLRRNVGSLEAGVKYLILGALSTAFLVYGFAWLYGVTGTMELSGIREALASPDVNTAAALFAFALIFVALAFKVGGAPFHLWIPDVYQGAPTPITAFLSVGSKAAGFIILLRLVSPFLASEALVGKVTVVLAVVALLTLLIGNLAALPQKNFKRLLAYSSVAHAGFLLMALACAPEVGSGGMKPAEIIAFYLGAYLFMTLLAFLAMTVIRKEVLEEDLESYRGLAKRAPLLALALLVAMASLAGIPLTAGFVGKFLVFKLAVEQEQWLLLGVGLLGAAAGFYYYFKIVASMYFSDLPRESSTAAIPVSPVAKVTMIALMAAIIIVGVAPQVIMGLFR